MDWSHLGFTSGRRTYKGNKLVGGVADSDHLRGTAADFTAPLSVLRKQFPNARILDEGDHRHVSGLSNVPFFGKQGTVGLVDGVDTTAPKGNAMQNPIMAALANYGAMSRPVNGIDPLAPLGQPPQMPPMGMMQAQQAQMPQMQPPQQPGKRKIDAGMIMGILGDALAAYGGQRGIYAPMMAQQREGERDDNRFRERLAAQMEMQRQQAMAKAQEPPAAVREAMYWDRLRQESPAQFGALMSTKDAVSPNYEQVTDGEGYVREVQKNRVETQVVDDVTYYKVNGKWFAAGGQ